MATRILTIEGLLSEGFAARNPFLRVAVNRFNGNVIIGFESSPKVDDFILCHGDLIMNRVKNSIRINRMLDLTAEENDKLIDDFLRDEYGTSH